MFIGLDVIVIMLYGKWVRLCGLVGMLWCLMNDGVVYSMCWLVVSWWVISVLLGGVVKWIVRLILFCYRFDDELDVVSENVMFGCSVVNLWS